MPVCECGKNPFVVQTQNPDLYNSLPKDHVLRTLMEEHFNIKRFVNEMKEAVAELLLLSELPETTPLMTELYRVTDHLLRTERHHIREESVIMLRLDRKMIPTNELNIRIDHDELRLMKRRFTKIVRSLYTTPLQPAQKELEELAESIEKRLIDHINKEDTILYPIALEQFSDDEWDEMKKECDRIGYICFTPNKD